MSYYSTDSREHRVNIGEEHDPIGEFDWFFEDPLFFDEETSERVDQILEEGVHPLN